METIDFSAFLCSLVSLSLSLSFNVNVFVKIVCILLEQSGSQSHIHTVEQQQKPKIDRANSSNALSLSLFGCLCVQCTHVYATYTYRNMPIFSPSIGWMHVRLLLLLERYLHRERERKKINPNPLQLEEMRTKDEKRRGIRKEAKKQLIMYAVTTHFFFSVFYY